MPLQIQKADLQYLLTSVPLWALNGPSLRLARTAGSEPCGHSAVSSELVFRLADLASGWDQRSWAARN